MTNNIEKEDTFTSKSNLDKNISIENEIVNTNGEIIIEHSKNKAKIPILVANIKLRGTIVEKINIPEGYIVIDECVREVIVEKCKIISDTLIVEGYILTSIQYCTPKNKSLNLKNCNVYENNLRIIKVKTPFDFATIMTGYEVETIQTNEKCERVIQGNHNKRKKDKNIVSACENYFMNSINFSEEPYGELIGWRITELDVCNKKNDNKYLYEVFIEKIALELEFDIYENKYVEIKLL